MKNCSTCRIACSCPKESSEAQMIEWIASKEPVDYLLALREMELRVERISAGNASEAVWLLEHPPIYTAGTSSKESDLKRPDLFPVYEAGRGGQYTYHGPGQRVAYVMLDLNRRRRDVREFVRDLETWLVRALSDFGVKGMSRAGRTGIWVCSNNENREDKIAAIGLKLRKWISWHGVSINVSPNLDHYSGIVPCGITAHGVTSLAELGVKVSMDEVDKSLKWHFEQVFESDKH